jgi:hypothetical protein
VTMSSGLVNVTAFRVQIKEVDEELEWK